MYTGPSTSRAVAATAAAAAAGVDARGAFIKAKHMARRSQRREKKRARDQENM